MALPLVSPVYSLLSLCCTNDAITIKIFKGSSSRKEKKGKETKRKEKHLLLLFRSHILVPNRKETKSIIQSQHHFVLVMNTHHLYQHHQLPPRLTIKVYQEPERKKKKP
jgi:hypothetical protein